MNAGIDGYRRLIGTFDNRFAARDDLASNVYLATRLLFELHLADIALRQYGSRIANENLVGGGRSRRISRALTSSADTFLDISFIESTSSSHLSTKSGSDSSNIFVNRNL